MFLAALRSSIVGVFAASLVILLAGSLSAQGPLITIHAPHPEQFQLVLDEIELDWSGAPGAKATAPGASAIEVAGVKLEGRDALRAVFSVSGAANVGDLRTRAMALRAANPGAEAHLVLYEPGRPRSVTTRRLLTKEVAMLLEKGADPRAALAGLGVGVMRAVPGVPNGYVAEAGDPIAALDLANALRQRSGVLSAYPLLKRQHFPR